MRVSSIMAGACTRLEPHGLPPTTRQRSLFGLGDDLAGPRDAPSAPGVGPRSQAVHRHGVQWRSRRPTHSTLGRVSPSRVLEPDETIDLDDVRMKPRGVNGFERRVVMWPD